MGAVAVAAAAIGLDASRRFADERSGEATAAG
jgi:hypothetical protein